MNNIDVFIIEDKFIKSSRNMHTESIQYSLRKSTLVQVCTMRLLVPLTNACYSPAYLLSTTGVTMFKELYYQPLHHIYKLVTNRQYLNDSLLLSKLAKTPASKESHAKVHGLNLSFPNPDSFGTMYRHIFIEEEMKVKFDIPNPRILDLGANIGLVTLYLKQLYSQAEIVAIEADPHIYDFLTRNVYGNGYRDVQLINSAAWHENTVLKFSAKGDWKGRVALPGDENIIHVPALDIREFLQDKHFDFMKMDIEGAEESVLPACRDALKEMKYVFIEYHAKAGRPQHLDQIIGILAEAGFRIDIRTELYNSSPLVQRVLNDGFDVQLAIFGWRE